MTGFTLEGISKELKERQEKLSQLERACKEVPSGATGEAARSKKEDALVKCAEGLLLDMEFFLWPGQLSEKDFTAFCKLYIRAKRDANKESSGAQDLLSKGEEILAKADRLCAKAEKGNTDPIKEESTINKVLDDLPINDEILQSLQDADIKRYYAYKKKEEQVRDRLRYIIDPRH